MASYWVSQERYFCKYCKVWLSNHKASISNHDQGKKHVEIVAEFFRKKREDKLKGAKCETDLKRQMELIEKAALRASEKDARLFRSSSTAPPPPPPPPPLEPIPPPPPPPPPEGSSPRASSSAEWRDHPLPPPPPEAAVSLKWDGEMPPPPPPPGKPPGALKQESWNERVGEGSETAAGRNGMIREDGHCFLDGRTHQDKLAMNSRCQILGLSEREWINGVIVAIAGDGAARRFNVAFSEAGADKETVRTNVESSSLRIPAGDDGTWIPTEKEEALPPPPPPDENTGYGGWQTVAVRMVDDTAEAERKRKKQEVRAAKRKMKREKSAERETMFLQAMDTDDAMWSYDPWGKGKYRGIDVAQETPRAPDAELHGNSLDGERTSEDGGGAAATPVAFKKRKGLSKGNMRKKRRSHGDDDD